MGEVCLIASPQLFTNSKKLVEHAEIINGLKLQGA